MKCCSQCGAEKPTSDYSPHSGTRDGLKRYCKACGRAAGRAYHKAHADEENAKSSAKYWENPAKKAAYDREYRAKHRTRIAAEKRAGEAKRRAQGWRRSYSEAERERVKVRSARWYAANSEHAKRRVSQYRRTHRDKHIAWGEAYRAKRRRAGAGVTARQWQALKALFGNRCLACGVQEHLTMDHVQPLSAGGRHDIRNVQPLCQSCNSRKNKSTIDFRPSDWESRVPKVVQATVA